MNLRPAMLRLVPDGGHLQLLHQRMREAWAQWAGEWMESSKQLAQHFPCFKGLGKFVFHVRWWQVSEFPFLVDAFGLRKPGGTSFGQSDEAASAKERPSMGALAAAPCSDLPAKLHLQNTETSFACCASSCVHPTTVLIAVIIDALDWWRFFLETLIKRRTL